MLKNVLEDWNLEFGLIFPIKTSTATFNFSILILLKNVWNIILYNRYFLKFIKILLMCFLSSRYSNV